MLQAYHSRRQQAAHMVIDVDHDGFEVCEPRLVHPHRLEQHLHRRHWTAAEALKQGSPSQHMQAACGSAQKPCHLAVHEQEIVLQEHVTRVSFGQIIQGYWKIRY